MWVMLPTGATRPVDLLSPSILAKAGDGFGSVDVDLSLPRWKIDNRMDLTKTLQRLGLDIFGAGDFGGLLLPMVLLSSRRCCSRQTSPLAEGTVAAAATAIVGDESAAARPRNQVTFRADHPFAFAIMDNTSGAPLFEGTVSDPS